MATQRVILAKIAGDAARILSKRFKAWPAYDSRAHEEPVVCRDLDKLVRDLRANAFIPPVIYFAEWIDTWSMGDILPGLGDNSARVIVGRKFEAALHQSRIKSPKSFIGSTLTQECKWLRARIREAEEAWKPLGTKSVILIARESLVGTRLDEETEISLRHIPDWLAD